MMMNLFSSFDPSNFFFNLGWLKFLFFMVFMASGMSKKFFLISLISTFLAKEFKVLSMSNLGNLMIIPLFLSLSILNLTSLLPFSFSPTAQISFVLPFTVFMWMSITFSSSTKPEKFLSHLVPEGSPFILMPFLVLIEITSNCIRPLTLSIRLVANIVAGHLLIHLLTNFIMSIPILSIPVVFLFLLILSIMELGVSVIQGYIFSSLVALYSNEIH